MDKSPRQPDAELQRQRETIRRGALRANAAVAGILLAVLVLALVAWLASVHSAQHQRRAEAAEQQSREQLWNSCLSQARAGRSSGLMQRRFDALTAVSNAAAIRPAVELRNEAIANLTLPAAAEEHPLRRFTHARESVDFSPDLERYVIATPQRGLAVFRASDHQELLRVDPVKAGVPTNFVYLGMGFSPGGTHLGAVFKNGSVVLWNLDSGQVTFAHHPRRYADAMVLAFSPDNRILGYYDSDQQEVAFCDVSTGRSLTNRARIRQNKFAFRPGTNQLAAVDKQEVRLWNYDMGDLLLRHTHLNNLNEVAWSPDGQQLAVSSLDGEVFLFDVVSPSGLRRKFVLSGHTEPGWAPQFSPDGRMLMTTAGEGVTQVWDAGLGRLLWRTAEGLGIRFSVDGRRVAFERPELGFGIWRLTPPVAFRTLYCRGARDQPLVTFDLSKDGRWLVARAVPGFHLWDLAEPNASAFFRRSELVSLILMPDRPVVLLGLPWHLEVRSFERWPGGGALAPDEFAESGFRLGPAKTIRLPQGAVLRHVTLSGDGRTCAVDLEDGRVVVLDLEGHRPIITLEQREPYRYGMSAASSTGGGRLGLSPDGRWLAAGFGLTSRPSVWDAQTGRLVKELDSPDGHVAFSPDGQWLLLGSRNEYSLWKTENWELAQRRPFESLAGIRGLMAFAVQPPLLAVTPTRQTVRLIDPVTWAELTTLEAPIAQSLRSLRLAHDGSRLAVATANNVVQVWDLAELRRHLAGMNLDWGGSNTPSPSMLSAVVHDPGTPPALVFFGLASVGLAAVAALFVLRRHRSLILDFVRAEAVAAQRRQELEATKVELLHSLKMKALGTLAAGIAHDFNNLLSVIRMSNKLIGREIPDNTEVREHVATIEEAVQQGKQVVGSMLGYSRTRPDDEAPKDVDELVGETVALLSKEFLSGIRLTLELNRNLPPVPVGGGKIEQILLNLVVNAAEAMQGQGRLRIATRLRSEASGRFVLAPRAAAQYIELTVADSGPGIPPEARDRIFEPFFTTKAEGNHPGTGLGLSMVYSISEQAGLGLDVDPGGANGGAQFTVLIPVEAIHPGACPQP